MTAKAESKRKRKSRAQRDTSTPTLAMVGFFDLLGFSDRVENIKTEAGLRTIAGDVDSIRQHFEFRSQDKATRDVQRVFDKTVLAFSDCVVTAVSLETEMVAAEGLFDVLGSEIWDIAHSQMRCTFEGHFLRGGIDVGSWYYHKAKDLLVSPAMVRAYKGEQDRACYPVIAVSDQLYYLLRDHPGRKAYSEDTDPFPEQFSSFKHPKSGKPVRFINYLRLIATSLDWQYDRATREAYRAAPRDSDESDERDRIMREGYKRNLVELFRRHKKVVTSAYRGAKGKVKNKYRFLAKYHNREIKLCLPKRKDILIKL
jgi:hypothetical protein